MNQISRDLYKKKISKKVLGKPNLKALQIEFKWVGTKRLTLAFVGRTILYGTFQDQGTTCVSRQSDANFFISKRNETLNFFAPLRMMQAQFIMQKKQPEIDFFAYFYT